MVLNNSVFVHREWKIPFLFHCEQRHCVMPSSEDGKPSRKTVAVFRLLLKPRAHHIYECCQINE